MFNNLVECAKTKKDNKRWAYFAVTSTIWTLALAGSIVGGIFLYDAKLDEQLSILTMLVNPPPPPPPPAAANTVSKTQPSQPTTSDIPTRTKLENIESAADIKARPSSPSLVKVSTGFGVDGGMDGGVDGGQLNGVLDGVIGSTSSVDAPPPPKPDPVVAEPEIEKPKPSIIRRSEGVLKGNTIFQGKPDYPAIARNSGITGEVKVEILISEEGSVVSTKVISGHPMLQQAALVAAKQWRFNPTLLNGTPVKVQGILTFRFTL
ncbi:MAG: energy transducer TonB [Acidobacteria bacterium]|nr:energy transducer TonB [Acidobacteriota bacterium]